MFGVIANQIAVPPIFTSGSAGFLFEPIAILIIRIITVIKPEMTKMLFKFVADLNNVGLCCSGLKGFLDLPLTWH